jgi:hypothetical protein
MTTPAWVKEQRPNGYAKALLTLADTLARHPDESVEFPEIYRSSRQDRDPWYRVPVKVGEVAAFCPRFVSFDDAMSFRRGALAMATSKEG